MSSFENPPRRTPETKEELVHLWRERAAEVEALTESARTAASEAGISPEDMATLERLAGTVQRRAQGFGSATRSVEDGSALETHGPMQKDYEAYRAFVDERIAPKLYGKQVEAALGEEGTPEAEPVAAETEPVTSEEAAPAIEVPDLSEAIEAFHPEEGDQKAEAREVEVPVDAKARTYSENRERLRQLIEKARQEAGVPEGSEAALTAEQAQQVQDNKELNEHRGDTLAAEAGVTRTRERMREAETAYLNAYRKFHKNKGLLGREISRRTKDADSRSLDELKRTYDGMRVVYGNALESSAQERLVSPASQAWADRILRSKYEKAKARSEAAGTPFASFEEFEQANGALVREKALERYNRIVRFNEVVKPAAEKAYDARMEGLDAKGRNLVQKGLGFLASGNAKLEKRLGKNGARVARAAITAALATGAVAFTGAAGTVGVAALAGYGGFRIARSLAGTFAGAVAAEGAGTVYERFFGRKAKEQAEESLKNRGRNRIGFDVNSLASIDAERTALVGRADERTLQMKKGIVKALTALGVGAGTAAALSELGAFQELASSEMPRAAAAEPDAARTEAGAQPPRVAPEASAAPAPAAPEGPNAPVESSPVGNAAPVAEAVIGRGEGFNSLFAELNESLRAEGAQASPVAERILSMQPGELSDRIGAYDPATNASAIMQEGDRLFLNENGDLIFERGGVEQRVMWADPSQPGGVGERPLEGMRMQPDAPVAAEEARVAAQESQAQETPLDTSGPNPISPTPETTVPQAPAAVPEAAPEPVEAVAAPEISSEPVQEPAVPAEPAPTPEPVPAEPQQPATQAPAPEQTASAAPAEASPAPAPQEAAASPAEGVPQPFTNHNGVLINPAEANLYGVTDPRTPGEPQLVVHGGEGMSREAFYARVFELARANPGKEIFFDSPEPVMADGRLQPWVGRAIFEEPGRFGRDLIPTDPSVIGVEFDPETFTSRIR